MLKGRIFNIQRFSIHDGPGVRTVIFFSGCNLVCKWCHNPEAISNKPLLQFYGERCISCGKCFEVCPNNAHAIQDGEHIIDRNKCTGCSLCINSCYAESLVSAGREINIDELERAILTDEEYFKHSDSGGVTFSGGEPMLQIDFLERILKICKDRGIHTAVDTAGAVPFEYFERIIPYCDLFLYDVKAYNSEQHRRLTGLGNELILTNLTKLSDLLRRSKTRIWVRVPVIKGGSVNNMGEMEDIALFLKDVDIDRCELLAYHRLGDSKYKALGLSVSEFETPSESEMAGIREIFERNQVKVF